MPVGGGGPGPPGVLQPPVECGTSPPTRSTDVGKQLCMGMRLMLSRLHRAAHKADVNWNWDSPNPFAARECAPPPLWSRGEGTLACGRGEINCGALYINKYSTLWRPAMVICRSSRKDRGGDFAGVDELARQDQLCAEHSLSGRKIAVFPESCSDTHGR